MSVLLGSVVYTRWVPSRQKDKHGWAQADLVTPAGTVTGCIQEGTPVADPTFTGQGYGQNEPEVRYEAVAYLDGLVDPGDRIGVPGGDLWRVGAVRLARDYTTAGLDCWVALLTRVVSD